MQQRSYLMALTTALALCAGTAQAFTCYTLYDRSDNVIYRNTLPPVDMSPEGDAQRDSLRAAGQYLMFFDSDKCPLVEFKFGESGTTSLSVDNIVGGLRPMTVNRPGLPASSSAPTAPRAPAGRVTRPR